MKERKCEKMNIIVLTFYHMNTWFRNSKMLSVLLLLRQCLATSQNYLVDFSSPVTMKHLSPEKCHLCNYTSDMMTRKTNEYLERHRKVHDKIFSNLQ